MVRTAHSIDLAVEKLRGKSKPENRAGMARFGIDTTKALGVSMPNIRSIGNSIQKDHLLAQELWESKIHEARILASLVDHPKWVTSEQMERWASDFNSWDLCDQVCGNLFDKSPYAHEKIVAWSTRSEEFVRRAAFALIAWRAVHDKNSPDETFLAYLPIILTASDDPRNFVKKAVNWALRQIGKRSALLYVPTLETAVKLAESENATARWIGRDAVKELDSAKMQQRLGLTLKNNAH
ncbi:MAG: DNA alkylation repair protein [Hyphomicrobiales bacterium]|nr:DNA alkylation repair protein [Hyphomicrobiales bacterium]